jgi:hypothetical protein
MEWKGEEQETEGETMADCLVVRHQGYPNPPDDRDVPDVDGYGLAVCAALDDRAGLNAQVDRVGLNGLGVQGVPRPRVVRAALRILGALTVPTDWDGLVGLNAPDDLKDLIGLDAPIAQTDRGVPPHAGGVAAAVSAVETLAALSPP